MYYKCEKCETTLLASKGKAIYCCLCGQPTLTQVNKNKNGSVENVKQD